MRFRKIWQSSWWVVGKLCEVPRWLLWRGLRHHCPMSNVSCIFCNKCLYVSYCTAGYFPDRPHRLSIQELTPVLLQQTGRSPRTALPCLLWLYNRVCIWGTSHSSWAVFPFILSNHAASPISSLNVGFPGFGKVTCFVLYHLALCHPLRIFLLL